MRLGDVHPALETPGYYQSSLRDLAWARIGMTSLTSGVLTGEVSRALNNESEWSRKGTAELNWKGVY
jgi:hypothetical protein